MVDVPEVRENPKAKDCCRLPDNMKVGEPEMQRHDAVMYRCVTCDRRHFVAMVDEGRIGVKGEEVG